MTIFTKTAEKMILAWNGMDDMTVRIRNRYDGNNKSYNKQPNHRPVVYL